MSQQHSSAPLIAPTRIGVIGDVHTDADGLAWALDVLRAQGAALLLSTGDLADGPQHGEGLLRACQLLRAADVLTVLGNHDRWLLDDVRRDVPDATFLDEIDAAARAFLQQLPASMDLITPLGLMLFGHGLGRDDMAALYPYDHGMALSDNGVLQALLREGRYQLALSGHTHRRMVRKLGAMTFINAGAISITREPCCLLLDFEARRARFFDRTPGDGTRTGPEFEL